MTPEIRLVAEHGHGDDLDPVGLGVLDRPDHRPEVVAGPTVGAGRAGDLAEEMEHSQSDRGHRGLEHADQSREESDGRPTRGRPS